jgi:Ca2+-transporting ATPase
MLALNLKQEKLPLIRQGIFSNRFATGWLVGMIALSLAMTAQFRPLPAAEPTS